MMNNNIEHIRIVSDCISGKTGVDENTLDSVAFLAEQLEALKQSSPLFEDIEFSEDVENLSKYEMMSAIS